MIHLLKQIRMSIHIATRLSLLCLPVRFSEWPELELSPPVSFRAQPTSAGQLLLIRPESCFNYKVSPRFIVSSQSGVAQGTMAYTGLPSSGSTYERSWARWCDAQGAVGPVGSSPVTPPSLTAVPQPQAPLSLPLPHIFLPTLPGLLPPMPHAWLTPPPSCLSSNVTFSEKAGALDIVLTLSSPAKSATSILPCSPSIAQVVACHLPGLHAPPSTGWAPQEADATMGITPIKGRGRSRLGQEGPAACEALESLCGP